MEKFLDSIPWAFLVIACLTLGLAPYNPPHFVEKLQMLIKGRLVRPIDWFDFFIINAARPIPFGLSGADILKRNPIVFVFFLVLFFLAAGYFSYSFLLPRYVEKRFLPSLGDKLSTSLTGQVFSIGLNEASLGDLIIGDIKNTAVSIGSIHADYSLFSIMDNKIEQVRINGLTLNLEISAGKLIIPFICNQSAFAIGQFPDL
jgi:hypothetical protein